LAAAFFRDDWPGPWAVWPLVLTLLGLAVIEGKIAKPQTGHHLDWLSVPDRLQSPLKLLFKLGGIALLILALLFVWNAWFHSQGSPRVRAALLAFFFAWESLFFAYGEMRTHAKQQTR
jgi:hypothetical protein